MWLNLVRYLALALVGLFFAVAIGFLIFSIVSTVYGIHNWINIGEARQRFVELSGTEDVVIVRHTNEKPIIGDPYDVIFELKVKGKPLSGRCTSGEYSSMVCRLYNPGEE
jgi:hypothetical protein